MTPLFVKKPEDYQLMASRTLSKELDATQQSTLCALGLAGEAGEVVDYLKKVHFHGHELDRQVVKKELGDVMWYIANLANLYDLTLTEIMQANVDKLRERYPEGFTKEDSLARVDVKE